LGLKAAASARVLLDQRSAFGRFALVHVVSAAGDAMLTVSLAGSLFFSISPHAAKGKVILYLLLTMAPFAVVAPLLGPAVDASRGARRLLVLASLGARALVAMLMAGSLHGLLLFPEAFTMLVLSRLYMVTKGSLVPLVVALDAAAPPGTPSASSTSQPPSVPTAPRALRRSVHKAPNLVGDGAKLARRAGPPGDLASANAALGLLGSLAASAAGIVAAGVLKGLGAPWVLRLDSVVLIGGALLAVRLKVATREQVVREAPGVVRGASPSPGVASVLPAEPASRPTSGMPWDAPCGSPEATRGLPGSDRSSQHDERRTERLSAFGLRVVAHPEVILALGAMSVLRALVGFTTFLLAFAFRHAHAATLLYGFVLVGSTLGALLGVLAVPRLRRVLSEPQILVASVWLVALAGAVVAWVGGTAVQALLTFTLGFAASTAKPALDALVQQRLPTLLQGRAFARFETRLQLAWVVGSLVPVASSLAIRPGDELVAAVAAVAGMAYVTSRRAALGATSPPH
jgi:hypothetical protein